MSTLTQVFEEARSLPFRSRVRLISKLIAADLPPLMTEEKDLIQREEDARSGRHSIEVAEVMKEARALAGIKGKPPALKNRKRRHS